MTRKIFTFLRSLLVFAGLLALILTLQTRQTSKSVEKVLKIGAIYDFTGVSGDIGKAFMEGNEIAKEIINNQGGVKGKPIQMIYEDNPNQEARSAINAAQKLVNINGVQAILTLSFSGISGMKSLAEQHQVPILEIIDASEKIGGLGEWIFGTGIYTEGQGRQVAEFAKNELQTSKAAILVGKDVYLLTVADAFKQKFEELGGTITAREEFIIGEADFRTPLTKIINSGAEAIFFAHLGEGGYGIKQAAELGFTGYFLGTDTMSIADVPKTAGDTLNGKTYFALWRNFDALTKKQQEFTQVYKQKYGKEPGDYLFYNVLGYDGLIILTEAMKDSDLTGSSIKNALYQIQNFDGLSGPISIDKTGINRDSKATMVMYKDGKIIRYQSPFP